MATKRPRVLVTIPDDLQKTIDDFRFTARGDTNTAAVRALIAIGLEAAMKELETPEGMERLRRRLEQADYRNFDKTDAQ